MEKKLRKYQKDILRAIQKEIKNNQKEIIIRMATGTGKYIIIENFINLVEPSKRILIITTNSSVKAQYKANLSQKENVMIMTFRKSLDIDTYDYIIIENTNSISTRQYKDLLRLFPNALFLFFSNIQIDDTSWLKGKKVAYTYSIEDSFKDGYINPKFITNRTFEQLIFKLLIKSKYLIDIEPTLEYNKEIYRPDFIISHKNKKLMLEIKEYASKFISNSILNGAVEQVKIYEKAWKTVNKEEIHPILIVSCQVSEEIKEKYYKNSQVTIIDIANLLYILQDNDETLNLLIESIQYDISQISPRKIINTNTITIEENNKNLLNSSPNQTAINLIKRLETLPPGKIDKRDKKYEKLCIDIINYLFKPDFTKTSVQHSTADQMFRMDLICGIKGTSEFWNILKQYYNTRFVVFEFKNYKEEINQNMIYITGKYLYKATLRNVAIIISRKGFSLNAHKAANAILTTDGKVIIDLSDNDIITMLRMKADQEDASDYLLEKFDNWLMSISN